MRGLTGLLIGGVLVLTGCASGQGAVGESGAISAREVMPPVPAATSAVDVALAPPQAELADWNIDTGDPAALASVSPYIVVGRVVASTGSHLNQSGLIETTYTVEVQENDGAKAAPATIQVDLAGGEMSLGEYIAELDERGLYQQVLGAKSDALLQEKDIDPATVIDPRAQDLSQPVIQNYQNNPTSASFLQAHRPEAFVFYLGGSENGVYYGAAFNHSLKYVRDGMVYDAVGDAGAPFPLARLRAG